ncbi:Pick C1-like protein 1 [Seminavis robusta]|uniref:Pick C1-like protein 1 n=1 Tax=Seminavis robusta TaxID=568900 RepID=A0A9N8HJ71_9STRA|nr:Pick C1-like protein 1 [Seminavis robusta]|eukprot:Sro672_g185040.1 Pick C1-like protein 1 (1023) ;mRNA; f:17457-20776
MLSTPSRELMSTDLPAVEQCSTGSTEGSDQSPTGSPPKTEASDDEVPTTPTEKNISKEKTRRGRTSSRRSQGPLYRDPICPQWSRCTNAIHSMIRRFVVALSVHAARHPLSYVLGVTTLSLAVLAIGFFTNFTIEVDYEIIYAPHGSRPVEHMDWIHHPDTGFPQGSRPFTFVLHNQGQNVLSNQGVRQMFQVLETMENTPGYQEICAQSSFTMEYANGTKIENACNVIGITRFWYYDSDLFESQELTDRQVMQAISNESYPDGVPVNRDFILGQYEITNETTVYNPAMEKEVVWGTDPTVTFAKSFLETLLLPETETAIEFETAAIENLLELQQQWREAAEQEVADGLQYTTYQLEFFTMISYNSEFEKAIFKDLPLTFMVGAIMVAFTCIVFYRPDRVKSRSLLGVSSVFTIAMSLAMGHGIMFVAGIPFTNMTMMLPFVVFGVGLDDTFIITGAYFRTDPNKDTVERIHETMHEVGSSISLTTTTTCLAFALGYISSIPAIQWLCLYAFLSLALVFLFQITLFVGFIVLDERRIKANRRDLCVCITVEEDESEQAGQDADSNKTTEDAALRFMTWYADFLMRPAAKAVVIAGFLYYFGVCIWSTTLLTQEFIVSDFLPEGSYVADYLDAVDAYAAEMVPLGIYFRGIDQSNETVQQQMRDYIDELMQLEQLDKQPPFCWVRDLANDEVYEEALGVDLSSFTFNEKLNLALSDPRVRQVYGEDIVRDEQGNITASRCIVFLSKIDFDHVQSQIKMLDDQRAVAVVQPLNEGQENFRMFTFADLYFLWEFYSVAVDELIATTIAGVVSVTVVAFLLMPHWTAVFYVGPIIVMLYIDLLGTLQFAGLHINAVTYVCLTISIGLLVDFLMHIMLRYYESTESTREKKVKDTLKTMGVSIMVGGMSTFLAVIPLAFSTSAIIKTVFTAFFAMVTLGVSHGLIFLPVVLSFIGPKYTPRVHPARIDVANSTDADADTVLDTKFFSGPGNASTSASQPSTSSSDDCDSPGYGIPFGEAPCRTIIEV